VGGDRLRRDRRSTRNLLRRLSDVEAENSYSAYAILVALGSRPRWLIVVVSAAACDLLVLAWRAARGADRRSSRTLTLALAADSCSPRSSGCTTSCSSSSRSRSHPRLSALWLVPLAMTVFEMLGSATRAGVAATLGAGERRRGHDVGLRGRRAAAPDVDSPRGSERKTDRRDGRRGFIGTTLARALVDDNEIVAVDNLHRDTLGGTALDGASELPLRPGRRPRRGAPRGGREGRDAPRARCLRSPASTPSSMSPVRTMRVNLIGTYNALEAALRTKDTMRALHRVLDERVFGTYAFKVDEQHVTTQGSVGEARWTYAVSKLAGEHMAHAYHDELGLPTVSVRPFNVYGPGQIGGGAIRAFIETALAGRDLVIHGDGSQIRAGATSTTWWRRSCSRSSTRTQSVRASTSATRVRPSRSTTSRSASSASRHARRARVPATALHGRRAAHPERGEGSGAPRVRGAGRARTKGLERTIAWYRENREPDERSRSGCARPGCRRGASSRALAEVVGTGQLTMGPKVPRSRSRSRTRRHGARRSRLVGYCRAPSRTLALEIGPGDEVIVPAYTFPATANVVELCGAEAVLVDVDPETFNVDVAAVAAAVTPRTRARDGGAPLRAPGRVGGAADRRAPGGRARRGRRRGARCDAIAARRAGRSASRRASRSIRARS
jgi:hypothetical protein